MYRKAHPLFLICNTPTHVGSGSDLGIVDLPIQREGHTGFPKFESSSLKGGLREAIERKVNSRESKFEKPDDPATMVHRLFGYDDGSLSPEQKDKLSGHFKNKKGEDQISFAGALGFTDARLLLFPVRSMKGVFAWITCLRVLKQFERDMQLVDSGFQFEGLNEKFLSGKDAYLFSPESTLKVGDKVILEEFTFAVANELNGPLQVNSGDQTSNFPDWLAENLFGNDRSYWSEKIKKDIVVLPDDDFKDFVNLSTEVITRTKIDNITGTVATGALFTEEYLPAESILYSLFLSADEFRAVSQDESEEKQPLKSNEVFDFFHKNLPSTIQLGGNASIGKGIINTRLIKAN